MVKGAEIGKQVAIWTRQEIYETDHVTKKRVNEVNFVFKAADRLDYAEVGGGHWCVLLHNAPQR